LERKKLKKQIIIQGLALDDKYIKISKKYLDKA